MPVGYATGVTTATVLDGFVVTAGWAKGSYPNDDSGGGMYSANGNPTLTNVTFSGNRAGIGGGMSGTGTLTNVTFSGHAYASR